MVKLINVDLDKTLIIKILKLFSNLRVIKINALAILEDNKACSNYNEIRKFISKNFPKLEKISF